nr:hypothetical protein CFP56_09209 [Quercus suber]POE77565.1 hypothetical protein CFP56_09212 [Quercus suber]
MEFEQNILSGCASSNCVCARRCGPTRLNSQQASFHKLLSTSSCSPGASAAQHCDLTALTSTLDHPLQTLELSNLLAPYVSHEATVCPPAMIPRYSIWTISFTLDKQAISLVAELPVTRKSSDALIGGEQNRSACVRLFCNAARSARDKSSLTCHFS